jgi:hypothetical protein
MARYDYDRGFRAMYDRDVPNDPYPHEFGVSERQISLAPQPFRSNTMDPNYRGGGYGGMRSEPGFPGQSSYGWYRSMHERDLGAAGGFQGRYGERFEHGRGRFDRDGIYHDRFGRQQQEAWDRNRDVGAMQGGERMGMGEHGPRGGRGWPRYDDEHRGPWDGGVRHDTRFVRQYNAHSPDLERGYDRGYGWAEHPRQGGGAGMGPSRENQYSGRNSGGFSEMHRPRQASR